MPSTIDRIAKRVPLSGLDVRTAMPCALWNNSCASLGALAAISGESQKSLSPLRHRCPHWEDDLPIRSGQAADVVRVEVRDQYSVDLFRRVPSATEVGYQVPELSPTKPDAGSSIDKDQMLPVLTR